MIKQTIYLNALGMLNALGNHPDEIWAHCLRGENRLEPEARLCPSKAQLAGRVTAELPELPMALKRYAGRNNRMLLAALEHIQMPLDALRAKTDPERIGIVLGSSTGGIQESTDALACKMGGQKFPADFDLRQQELGSSASFVSALLGLKGPAYTISTACSSGSKAMLAARRLIQADHCDAAIVGACDSLCQITLQGFSSLEAISDGRTNPMSIHRDGINVGEGVALFLMSREPAEVALLGGGECSDAYHISSPQPEGLGAESAMRLALDDAGLQAQDIDYINLHGTGTPHNDSMESKAIARVFPNKPFCSSTKPMTGHTLGAAGAIEAGLCWLSLTTRKNGLADLPPHLWDGQADPECPNIALVEHGTSVAASPMRMLSNSFAFGGSNCAIILGGD